MPIKRSKSEAYTGFKVASDKRTPIDVIDIPMNTLNDKKVEITNSWFWENYVMKRKPALLKSATPIEFEFFTSDVIAETLDGNDLLQVEELVEGGFGSGRKRLKMTFDEFNTKINNGECLYMTTQYEDFQKEEEEDEEELDDFHDDFEEDFEELEDEELPNDDTEPIVDLDEIYQPPLDNLVLKEMTASLEPIPLSILKGYTPQQINLWMGNSKETTLDVSIQKAQIKSVNKGLPSKATSSGLHHDHADNLYTLVEGEKSFSLWSPDCAHDLYTIGDIRTVYNSGIIDYIRNEKAPNWNSLNERGIIMGEEPITKVETDLDPPSFSQIPPSLLHLDELNNDLRPMMESYLERKFPLSKTIANMGIRVDLKAGDCLYLPAGWFHEVSSSGKHIAINHWFHVPKFDS